ncbi:hypothetical protein MCON_3010 [Methanothrix soehngenii GP6]|uniref:Uncharacterized protein n=1 Tax=Methanothrix soehngenii (strain ATCC 5969 / DSM 3671 / JCM 10134 / NBRC 103675 / OCM 69 / GP-6) TaxID=990316 RepID=F4BT53_METSG|nr:hypothetical protein MCON_3010 [Methanothrix soehngenii GP6]
MANESGRETACEIARNQILFGKAVSSNNYYSSILYPLSEVFRRDGAVLKTSSSPSSSSHIL